MINFLLVLLVGVIIGRAIEMFLNWKYKPKGITLLTHITAGGVVYLTDDHNFRYAKIIIRLDGGEDLIRCVTEDDILKPILKELG